MKNQVKRLATGLLLLLAAAARAQDEAGVPTPKSVTVGEDLTAAEARALVHTARMFYAFWNTGEEKYLRESVAADFRDNTLPKGRPQGYKGILFASAHFRKAVPDLRCSVEDLIIAGDKIVCRMVFTGHNTGPLDGHPPSGRAVRFIAIDVLHVRGGKIFEDWHLEDNLTFLQQVGAVPAK
jgi:predicted ester cyclase